MHRLDVVIPALVILAIAILVFWKRSGTSLNLSLPKFKGSSKKPKGKNGNEEMSAWKKFHGWRKDNNKGGTLKKLFPALLLAVIILAAFNFALYALWEHFDGEYGTDYFSHTYWRSNTFYLLGFAILATAIGSAADKNDKNKKNPFGPFIGFVMLATFVLFVSTLWGGFASKHKYEKNTAGNTAGTNVTNIIPASYHSSYHFEHETAKYTAKPSKVINGPQKDSAIAILNTLNLSAGAIDTLMNFMACESGFTQYNPSEGDGALHNKDFYPAVGILQINIQANGEEIGRLGYDVTKLRDNLQYGAILYSHRGWNPWAASKSCWGDRYKSPSAEYRPDRTPDQIVAATRHEDEIVFIDAPSDTTWSVEAGTDGREISLQPSDNSASYEVLVHGINHDTTFVVEPGSRHPLTFTPRSYQFRRIRSDSNKSYLTIIFTRKG